MAAVQRSIRIVCELLEAGMFGLIYGSFMINEGDIVFSKWTEVLFFHRATYRGASAHRCSAFGMCEKHTIVSLHPSVVLRCEQGGLIAWCVRVYTNLTWFMLFHCYVGVSYAITVSGFKWCS